MFNAKKERLYISDLLDNPAITYPSYYVLSSSSAKNEFLQSAIISLHSFDFSNHHTPKDYKEIFDTFNYGGFAIYKENYIVGFFGNKMMHLESNGWSKMVVNVDIFVMDNWLV